MLELVVYLVHLREVVQCHVGEVLPETHHFHLELLRVLLRETLLVVKCFRLRLIRLLFWLHILFLDLFLLLGTASLLDERV